MTISQERIERAAKAVDPSDDVRASHLIGAHSYGFDPEGEGGPIERVNGAALQADIARALTAARIEGMREAREIVGKYFHDGDADMTIAAIDARIAAARERDAQAAEIAALKAKLAEAERERDEARAFAKELQTVLAAPITCDVLLPPATIIRKGCSLTTLKCALEHRAQAGWPTSFEGAPVAVLCSRVERLRAALKTALEWIETCDCAAGGIYPDKSEIVIDARAALEETQP